MMTIKRTGLRIVWLAAAAGGLALVANFAPAANAGVDSLVPPPGGGGLSFIEAAGNGTVTSAQQGGPGGGGPCDFKNVCIITAQGTLVPKVTSGPAGGLSGKGTFQIDLVVYSPNATHNPTLQQCNPADGQLLFTPKGSSGPALGMYLQGTSCTKANTANANTFAVSIFQGSFVSGSLNFTSATGFGQFSYVTTSSVSGSAAGDNLAVTFSGNLGPPPGSQ